MSLPPDPMRNPRVIIGHIIDGQVTGRFCGHCVHPKECLLDKACQIEAGEALLRETINLGHRPQAN